MQIEGCVALVSGANKANGIGRAFVEALIKAGAKKVYATGRNPEQLMDLEKRHQGVLVPVPLDITDAQQIEKVASIAHDVDLLINNAGVAQFSGLIAAQNLSDARMEMDVNYFGTLAMIRALSPILKTNGGGTIVNLSSIAGLVNMPFVGSYSASKAAVHSMIQGVRAELAGQGTKVIGVYPGLVDTDMVTDLEMPKVSPASIAVSVLTAIANGTEDVFPDDMAVELHTGLLGNPKEVEMQFAEMLPTV